MPEFLLERSEEAVTELRLNRPAARNALSRQVMAELDAAVLRVGADPQTHVIVLAAGCQLVASCDLAVASSAAKFATPGVNIGLFCSTPMVALSRNVPRKQAMEMLLTGEMIAAEKAETIGLVNRVVPPEHLERATWDLARQIASKAPKTLKIGKEAFYRQSEMPLAEAYDYAARVMVDNLMISDAREGIGAFVEKRQPNWERLDGSDQDG